jgi:hypothetical protein
MATVYMFMRKQTFWFLHNDDGQICIRESVKCHERYGAFGAVKRKDELTMNRKL